MWQLLLHLLAESRRKNYKIAFLTLEQLRPKFNSLMHAFSAELLTVLSCSNFSNFRYQPKTMAFSQISALF